MSWDDQRRRADQALRDQQRQRETAEHERREREAAQRRQGAAERWRQQRLDDDGKRHAEDRVRAGQREARDEQHRLRHAAEDEERRRRKVLDLAQGRVRTAVYRARTDPDREPDLVRARAEAAEAEHQWRLADDQRRRWPSAWPW